ncbi:MAG: hypothetical protein QOG23_384 [Blastocatellia bacterium]|nr:hypothetical protein [Blastocatellia bacterium]
MPASDRVKTGRSKYSEQRQNSNNFVPAKSFDVLLVIAKYCLDVPTSAIPTTYPNYFWRKTKQDAKVTEVRVFGDDNKAFAPCVLAHFLIRNQVNAEVVYVI